MVRTVIRIVLSLCAAGLLIGGAMFLWTGVKLHRECTVAEAATVLDMPIDVSVAGEHHGVLKQIASFTCKQSVCIVTELREGESAAEVLRGVELDVLVRTPSGEGWMEGFFPSTATSMSGTDGLMITMSSPMPEGDYPVVVEVISPVPELAGRKVRIVSRYQLCGLEWMGSVVGIAGGVGGLLFGTLFAAIVYATRKRPRSVVEG